MRKTHGCFIQFRKELESRIILKPEPLKNNFLKRILAFTASGTYVVDIKDDASQFR